jgi:hypothetical protein
MRESMEETRERYDLLIDLFNIARRFRTSEDFLEHATFISKLSHLEQEFKKKVCFEHKKMKTECGCK